MGFQYSHQKVTAHPGETGVLLNVTTTSVEEPSFTSPERFALEQNYPNPFNPNSEIRYQISEFRHVRLAVYDLLGREIAVLVNERKQPGQYQVTFDASRLASGTYFCRMVAGEFVQTRRLLLIR